MKMESLKTVSELANKLLNKDYTINSINGNTYTYCPKDLGYTFEFNNRKRAFGVCNYRKRIIYLSRPLCALNLDKINTKITDTILHEIAHALCVQVYGYKGRGHDYKWVSIAKQIGCNGKRCYDGNLINNPTSKYTLTCPSCGNKSGAHRKITRNKSCGFCSGGYYQEKFKLQITQNY